MPISKNIKFFRLSPDNGTGRFFNDQKAFKFPSYPGKVDASESVPSREAFDDIKNTTLKSKNQLKANQLPIELSRLVYFVFLQSGEILTLCFGTKYVDQNKSKEWAEKKIIVLDKYNGDPVKLINAYNNDTQRISRGLDQYYDKCALIWFYINNKTMYFTQDKFSSAPVYSKPPPGNPFKIIGTTDGNFFGLYNSFKPDQTGDPLPDQSYYDYKFNLHMKTGGYTVDIPRVIPFVVDPVIKNTGPP